MNRGASWAPVHRVVQSRTRLKWLSVHACIGEGNGDPLQYSCLENPRDRGAWWAAVCEVAQNQTWLKQPSSSSSKHLGFYSLPGHCSPCSYAQPPWTTGLMTSHLMFFELSYSGSYSFLFMKEDKEVWLYFVVVVVNCNVAVEKMYNT